MKTFKFNKVFIIHSLSSKENEIIKSVPNNLAQKINDSIKGLQSNNNLPSDIVCESIDIQNKQDWDNCWNKIEKDANNGAKPIIHLVFHGNENGIAASIGDNYDFIYWDELYKRLGRINMASHFNLFVTMCVCHGFWSLTKLFTDGERIPFCGIIACPDVVDARVAEVCFPKFYMALLTNQKITDAKQELDNELRQICEINHWDFQKDMLNEFSDTLFVKAFKKLIKYRSNDVNLMNEAITALSKEGYPINTFTVWAFMNDYKIHIEDEYDRMVKFKFMLDLYPEERERLEIPDFSSINKD